MPSACSSLGLGSFQKIYPILTDALSIDTKLNNQYRSSNIQTEDEKTMNASIHLAHLLRHGTLCTVQSAFWQPFGQLLSKVRPAILGPCCISVCGGGACV